MRKFIVFCAAALMIFSCSPKERDSFEVKGKVWDLNGYATLTYRDPASMEIIADTVDLVDGCYCFKGKVSEPTYGQIIFHPEGEITIRSSIILENALLESLPNYGFLVSDGQKVRTLRDLEYKGGPNNDFNVAISKSYEYLDDMEKYKGLKELMKTMSGCGVDDLEKYIETRKIMEEKYGKAVIKEYLDKQKEEALKFVLKHPDVEIAGYYLQQCNANERPLEELEADFAKLTPKVQNCFFSGSVRATIENKKEQAAQETAKEAAQ